MLLKDTEFSDVKIVYTDDEEYFGILTSDGIEACALRMRFAFGWRVLSSFRDVVKQVDNMLKKQIVLDYPRGFTASVGTLDIAFFVTQNCTADRMELYLEQKCAALKEEIELWNRERLWDTNPVFSDELEAMNFAFDAESGALYTDGGVNSLKHLETPTSVDGIRVKALAPYALAAYRELESLVISNSITEIPEFLCFGFIFLVSVKLSSNMECIPDGAFCKCKVLKTVLIPEGVKRIGREAFYMDCSIQRLQLPSSVESVGSCALVGVRKVDYHGTASGYPWGASSVLAKVNY